MGQNPTEVSLVLLGPLVRQHVMSEISLPVVLTLVTGQGSLCQTALWSSYLPFVVLSVFQGDILKLWKYPGSYHISSILASIQESAFEKQCFFKIYFTCICLLNTANFSSFIQLFILIWTPIFHPLGYKSVTILFRLLRFAFRIPFSWLLCPSALIPLLFEYFFI